MDESGRGPKSDQEHDLVPWWDDDWWDRQSRQDEEQTAPADESVTLAVALICFALAGFVALFWWVGHQW